MEERKIVVELIQVVNFCMPVYFCAFVSESCLVTSSTLFVSIPFVFFEHAEVFSWLYCVSAYARELGEGATKLLLLINVIEVLEDRERRERRGTKFPTCIPIKLNSIPMLIGKKNQKLFVSNE